MKRSLHEIAQLCPVYDSSACYSYCSLYVSAPSAYSTPNNELAE